MHLLSGNAVYENGQPMLVYVLKGSTPLAEIEKANPSP